MGERSPLPPLRPGDPPSAPPPQPPPAPPGVSRVPFASGNYADGSSAGMGERTSQPPLPPGEPPSAPLPQSPSPPPPLPFSSVHYAEGSSPNTVQIDYHELERLRRIEQIHHRLQITSLRRFVDENRHHLQNMVQLKAGQAMGDVPTGHFITPCKDYGRSHFDSLVLMVTDNLLNGLSYGGCWDMDTVLVSNEKCFLEDSPIEDGTRIEYASRDLRALCHILVDIFSIIGYGYPPFFSHLMDLLITPPGDYDTDPEVRRRYLLSIRNNVAFASPARLFALLVNFAQLCCCIPISGKKKLEETANTMPRFFDPLNIEFKRFTLHYDWTEVGSESNLLQKLKELKKLKEKKQSKGKRKNPPEPEEEWKSQNLFPSLVYQLRIFFIHGPEVMKDDNGNMVLDDFMELIYIIDYLLEDALPNVVEYILQSLDAHALVRSMWNVYDRR